MKRILVLIMHWLWLAVPTSPRKANSRPCSSNWKNPGRTMPNGSLWQVSSGGLVEDFKARVKGDTVTVVITETASASKEATTSTNRTTAVAAGIPNLMGLETDRSQEMDGFEQTPERQHQFQV